MLSLTCGVLHWHRALDIQQLHVHPGKAALVALEGRLKGIRPRKRVRRSACSAYTESRRIAAFRGCGEGGGAHCIRRSN